MTLPLMTKMVGSSDKNVVDNNTINNIYISSSSNDEDMNKVLEHFELTWDKYPNKKGKAKALELYLQWIKGRKISKTTIKLTDEQMYYAVLKYKKECEENNTETKFIKHGDTFFNKAIVDYVED